MKGVVQINGDKVVKYPEWKKVFSNDMKRDLYDSKMAMQHIGWPKIKELMSWKNAELIPVESCDKMDKLQEALDWDSDIDYIVRNDKGQFPVASRFQFGNTICDENGGLHNSFTIRKSRLSGAPTENFKVEKALESGGLCPTYTVQGYVVLRPSDGWKAQLQSIAIVLTKELYGFKKRYSSLVKEKKSDNLFDVVYWDYLKHFSGIKGYVNPNWSVQLLDRQLELLDE